MYLRLVPAASRTPILRLLTYNIKRGGIGRDRPLRAVIAASRPDIVVLQEATTPAVVEALAAGTGMAQWGATGGESLAFMSREPVAHYEWHRPKPSRHAFLEIVPREASVRIFGVHLSARHAAWTERRRTRELRAVLAAVARPQTGFHVLVGDFNTLAPGERLDPRKLPYRLRALVWLSGGRIRWRTIQMALDAGYVDAYRARHPFDAGFTFPSWDPHIRLDCLLVPEAFAERVHACDVVTDDATVAASDHLPLAVDLA